ncbi:MAG: hypothetical protein E7485_01130 [Ruminococcaceae bacterium]|nr:hypothetical protein [Oscillospiraceae bacterium]
MDSFTINMRNSTQAHKARALLAKKGIRSTVERTHRQGAGCSFALRVYAGRREACLLLSAAGIPCDIS